MLSSEYPPERSLRIGPYRLIRQLGQGSMGTVYEGIHEEIARRVAIKILNADCARDPEATRRLFTEARAANLIDHPGLVPVSDYGQLDDGTAYLVMELLKGETLGSRLRSRTQLGVLEALQIAWQIADALGAAHTQGILHRDLKPENVMLVPDGVALGGQRARLLDFGLAKLTLKSAVQTDSKALLGTPMYMSPEQCRGAGDVDALTDVYSLGVMLYQMLSGRPPFLGESGELIGYHLFLEPPLLSSLVPELPVETEAFVHRLLVKDRRERPSMIEVRDTL